MKKTILIIAGILVIGGAVYAYMQNTSKDSQATEKLLI